MWFFCFVFNYSLALSWLTKTFKEKLIFIFCFVSIVALKSSNCTRPEINGIQDSCRTTKPGEGIHLLEGELLLQVSFTVDIIIAEERPFVTFNKPAVN